MVWQNKTEESAITERKSKLFMKMNRNQVRNEYQTDIGNKPRFLMVTGLKRNQWIESTGTRANGNTIIRANA